MKPQLKTSRQNIFLSYFTKALAHMLTKVEMSKVKTEVNLRKTYRNDQQSFLPPTDHILVDLLTHTLNCLLLYRLLLLPAHSLVSCQASSCLTVGFPLPPQGNISVSTHDSVSAGGVYRWAAAGYLWGKGVVISSVISHCML